MLGLGELRALQHLGVGRVGRDAAELDDVLAAGFQNAAHLVVNAVALDGAAAVTEHHVLTVSAHLAGEIFLHTALAEIGFRRVFKNEVVHNLCASCLLLRCFLFTPIL